MKKGNGDGEAGGSRDKPQSPGEYCAHILRCPSERKF